MITKSGDQHAIPGRAPAASWASRLALFGNVHAMLILPAVGLTLYWRSTTPLVVEAVTVFGALVIAYVSQTRMAGGRFGVGNALTLGRLVVLLGAALMLQQLDAALIFLLFIANVVLDVVDGKVARRRQEQSAFGAGFDAEVDALFVLVAGLYFVLAAGIGHWVLIAGLLRYVYQLVAWAAVGGDFVEPPRRSAKIMAGLVFALLPAAVVLDGAWQLAVLIVATLVSAASFSLSALALVQHRAHSSL